MDTKLVIAADDDESFRTQMTSLVKQGSLDVRFYSSVMDLFPVIGSEKPSLIFISLNLPDINDFVMHDLLKKTEAASIPVYTVYSRLPDKELDKYKRIRYKAKAYYEKPIDDSTLKPLFDELLPLSREEQPVEIIPMSQQQDEFVFPGMEEEDGQPLFMQDESAGHIDIETEFLPASDSVQFIPLEPEPSYNPQPEVMPEPETIPPTDENEISDEDIDALVKGDFNDQPDFHTGRNENNNLNRTDSPKDQLKDANEFLAEIENKPFIDLDDVVNFGENEVEFPKPEPGRRVERELEVQIITLESQNEFLRDENKKFSNSIHSLNQNVKEKDTQLERLILELDKKTSQYEDAVKRGEADKTVLERKVDVLEKHTEQLEDQKSDLTRRLRDQELQIEAIENEKNELQKQIEEISNQLIDKDRELVARNHKFEVELKNKLDEVLQEAEDRLISDFRQKENKFALDLQQVQNEKKELELDLLNKIEELSNANNILLSEKQELKKREENLNRTVSSIAEEKVALSEKISSTESMITRLENEMKDKETELQQNIDVLTRENEDIRKTAEFYKSRFQEIADMLEKTMALTDISDIKNYQSRSSIDANQIENL